MFGKAIISDIDKICIIYGAVHGEKEAVRTTTGWIREAYPTRKTSEYAVRMGNMFVEEDDKGRIVAAVKINREQKSTKNRVLREKETRRTFSCLQAEMWSWLE